MRLTATLLLLVAAASPLVAQSARRARAAVDSFAPATRLPVDPAVRIGTLPNGLRYYVRRNPKPEDRVELRLVVNAGSILEDDDQQGLAHFVEHMAFNGTTHFQRNDVVKYLESIGVRFGADLNAQTGFDETTYILPLPADSQTIMRRGFEFLADVAGGILFDSAAVTAERGVVLAEWRTGLGAGERIRDKQFPVLLHGSRYATRLPIGRPEIIERATPAPLRRFWRDWYRPDLMAVVAVGDANPDSLVALIRRNFLGLRNLAAGRPRTLATIPRHDSTLITVATDPEVPSSSINVIWKLPPTRTTTVRDVRRDLVQQLADAILNQRLNELSRKPEAPFVGAGGGGGSFVRGTDSYQLGANAKEGKLLESLALVLTEAARAAQHGYLTAELDRARTSLLRGYERAFAERDKSPSDAFVDEYITHYLTGDAIPGIAYEYALAQRLLPQITIGELNAIAATRRGEANRVVTVTMPEKAELRPPTEAEIRSVFRTVAAAPLAPWTETVAEGPLVPTAPSPGRVVAVREVPGVSVTEWTLSNGARVYVKPTDFRADEVLMTAWSAGGTSVLPDSDAFRGALATTIIGNGGVGNYSQVDLTKRLTGKVANATPFIGDLSQGLSGRASPRDLETMLQLAWLRITAPRMDTTAARAMLQQFEAVLRNKDANPAAVFGDTVQMTLGNGSPRVRPLSVATLAELEPSQLLAIYRQRFGNPGRFTWLFVGNVDTASLRPLVERWIAPLPATGPAESWREVSPTLLTGQVEKTVRKGLAPQSRTVLALLGTGTWSRDDALALEFLGDVLQARLLDRLRESLGATYSVSVRTAFASRPRSEWQLAIDFGSAPDQADALYAAVRQELDSLRRVPPSDAEVDRVREQARRQLELARRENPSWLQGLQERLELGEEPATIFVAREAAIAAVTPAKLARAAATYLTEQNLVRFVLLPEMRP